MVESIKAHSILIPAIVKSYLPDDEAYAYVIKTNLMQRLFTDLSVSEKTGAG